VNLFAFSVLLDKLRNSLVRDCSKTSEPPPEVPSLAALNLNLNFIFGNKNNAPRKPRDRSGGCYSVIVPTSESRQWINAGLAWDFPPDVGDYVLYSRQGWLPEHSLLLKRTDEAKQGVSEGILIQTLLIR
jgi:hypothetical protein